MAIETIDLSDIIVLGNVPQESLNWLEEKGHRFELKEDEFLFQKGDAIEHLYILLGGQIKIYAIQDGKQKYIDTYEPGKISGMLPYSRMQEAAGYGKAQVDSLIFRLPKSCFPHMIRDHHELTSVFVHMMTNRVRDNTSSRLQDEKLMALGKLSAGLAHELNNPSSAIVRSSQALKKHLSLLPDHFKKVIKIKMSDELVDTVNDMMFERIKQHQPDRLSLMERSEREDELVEWLDELDIEDSDEIAENLVEFGFTEDQLQTILNSTTEAHFPPVIKWVSDNLVTERVVGEIENAAQRIAELVKSVKGYTHMDRANDRQPVDVREGMRSTLTMLGHKMREHKIKVEEDFTPNLTKIQGFPGELNQVWTNLIDNAIDAMEDGGTLGLKAYCDKETVAVEISDTGKGIPEEDLSHIFEPFFTTKPIGKGTGMGLEVVQRILANHQATIKVESEPGRTEFRICFPLESQVTS